MRLTKLASEATPHETSSTVVTAQLVFKTHEEAMMWMERLHAEVHKYLRDHPASIILW